MVVSGGEEGEKAEKTNLELGKRAVEEEDLDGKNGQEFIYQSVRWR